MRASGHLADATRNNSPFPAAKSAMVIGRLIVASSISARASVVGVKNESTTSIQENRNVVDQNPGYAFGPIFFAERMIIYQFDA